MGVRVRTSRRTSVWVPFWLAIPVWLVWFVVVWVFGVFWVLWKTSVYTVHAVREVSHGIRVRGHRV